MNFEELKKTAQQDTAPEIKDTQSIIIITTESVKEKISVQHATIGTAMHLAQAITSIIKNNPSIASCMNFLEKKEIEKAANKSAKIEEQKKYN